MRGRVREGEARSQFGERQARLEFLRFALELKMLLRQQEIL
jgi:hypothetical protein